MPVITTEADRTEAGSGKAKRKNYSHVAPVAPLISLNKPGRLRAANMLALFNVSHSTFYDGMDSGRYPKPDGHDKKPGSKAGIPYWLTSTARKYLVAK
jgi:hypothetical protein